MWETFAKSFTTFFAVVGPVDVAVLFTALTAGMDAASRRAMALRGVLIAAGGGALQWLREDRVGHWNSTDCEQPGAGTRREQCGDVEEEYQRLQYGALSAYGLGAALFGTGVTLWTMNRRQRDEPRARWACSVGATVRCRGTF